MTLQPALDSLDQGMSVFDGERRLVLWNRRFVELLGLPAHLARAGTSYEDVVRHLAERGARFYSERGTADGRVLGAQTHPLPDGGFVTVYTDVSERARAESLTPARTEELEARVNRRTLDLRGANEKLRQNLQRLEQVSAAHEQSEARLRLITDALPAAIAYVDASERLRFANRRFAGLVGGRRG